MQVGLHAKWRPDSEGHEQDRGLLQSIGYLGKLGRLEHQFIHYASVLPRDLTRPLQVRTINDTFA